MNSFNRARKKLVQDLKKGIHLNVETLPSMSQLVHINELGMLTLNSQQGRIENGEVPVDRQLHAKIWRQQFHESLEQAERDYEENVKTLDEAYRKAGGQYEPGIAFKEKAFLIGIMPVEKAGDLVDMLNQVDNLVAWYVRQPSDMVTFVPVTFEPTSWFGAFGMSANYPLTGVTALNTEWHPFSECVYGKMVRARPHHDKDFACVTVMDTRFGHLASAEDGLFAQVIKALRDL